VFMAQLKEKYTAVGIGEVLWDIYRDRRHLGGAPANFAVHAAQLGDQGVLVSRIGDDVMGRELIQAFRQRQLAVDYIQIDGKKPTGTVMVSLDVMGVPGFRCSQDVAFDYLQFGPELETLAQNCDAVLFGTLAQRSPETRKTIWRFLQAAKNAVRVFDVNSRAGAEALREIVPASLHAANVLKVNRSELEMLQAVLRRSADTRQKFIDFLLKKYHLKLLAVTYGEGGCEIFDGQAMCKIDGLPAPAIDTTGAGDAFAAGMVHKLLRGASLREIGEYANLLGAFLCTQSGATPVFNSQELEIFRESL
jgi:fructokinase